MTLSAQQIADLDLLDLKHKVNGTVPGPYHAPQPGDVWDPNEPNRPPNYVGYVHQGSGHYITLYEWCEGGLDG